MRGAVSLAAALALPLTTDAGTPFPNRDLIIFLTFGVILGTLVCQGLTLPVADQDAWTSRTTASPRRRRTRRASSRRGGARAARRARAEGWAYPATVERTRGLYGFRVNRFSSRFDPDGRRRGRGAVSAYQRLRRELLDAERAAVVDLRRRQLIDDEVMRRVTRDLDLEDLRLDV